MATTTDIKEKFEQLRFHPETETVEFKEAKNNFDFNTFGKYFSALSNEANLQGVRSAWMVFGVDDKKREVKGSNYRNNEAQLQSLKHELAQKTTGNITFTNIFELIVDVPEGKTRIILFEIPAAPQGVPIAFDGHFYGRDGESLVALNLQEIETIRNQRVVDWSAQVVPEATVDDLDAEAINKARFEYKKKNPNIADEISEWDDITFLNKTKITINGQITNAALILLGNEDSIKFLRPAIAQITWILKDKDGIEIDYHHFAPPFLLSVDRVLSKIRNITFRYIPDNTLFPDEVMQYDNYVIREALHNCIAHQDYSLQERINVIENPDTLVFSNGGAFIPKTIENVIRQDAPQRYYRNAFLCAAMVNLNMIDTIGSGIKRMFVSQRKRFFPMPDYKIDDNALTVTIYGKVLNEKYVMLLKTHIDMTLNDCIALDAIQKGKTINKDMAERLRKLKCIEGRYPKLFFSEQFAKDLRDVPNYIKQKGLGRKYYKDMVMALLKNSKDGTSRKEIDGLLLDMIPQSSCDKKGYIGNLLKEMKEKDNLIYFDKNVWKIYENI